MSAMVLDTNKVNSLVMPNLEKTKNTLDEAYKLSNTLMNKLPSSASSRNRLSEIRKKITTTSNNVNTVKIKLDQKLEKAKTIESKNKSKTVSLAAAAGAVAAGAIASTSVVGRVAVAGAVAAAGAVAVANSTTVSSVGKALKNTGAKVAANVKSFFSNVWDGIKDFGKSIWDACKKIASKVVSFVKEKISPIIKALGKGLLQVGKAWLRTGATIVNLAVSLFEGAFSLVEALADVVLIVLGGACSLVTAFTDLVIGISTGEWNWECTGTIWKKWIMPWVGYDLTDQIFDGVEKINIFDKYAWDWGKRKSGDGTACSIAKSVGYVTAIIVASVFTAGGASAFTSMSAFSSAAATATIQSTTLAGLGKFGQETQKGYNKLSDEEKENLGSISKVLLASGVKGGIEAGTWYITYGNGAENLMKSSNKVVTKLRLDKLAKVLKDKSTFNWTKGKVISKILPKFGKATLAKAGIQFTKAYANEAASVIADGDFALEKATTDAVVGATTSIIYDNTLGTWMEKGTKEARIKVASESKASTTASDVFGYETEVHKGVKEQLIDDLDEVLDDLDPLFKFATKDAGGKKIIGGAAKNTIKEIERQIINLIPKERSG